MDVKTHQLAQLQHLDEFVSEISNLFTHIGSLNKDLKTLSSDTNKESFVSEITHLELQFEVLTAKQQQLHNQMQKELV